MPRCAASNAGTSARSMIRQKNSALPTPTPEAEAPRPARTCDFTSPPPAHGTHPPPHAKANGDWLRPRMPVPVPLCVAIPQASEPPRASHSPPPLPAPIPRRTRKQTGTGSGQGCRCLSPFAWPERPTSALVPPSSAVPFAWRSPKRPTTALAVRRGSLPSARPKVLPRPRPCSRSSSARVLPTPPAPDRPSPHNRPVTRRLSRLRKYATACSAQQTALDPLIASPPIPGSISAASRLCRKYARADGVRTARCSTARSP